MAHADPQQAVRHAQNNLCSPPCLLRATFVWLCRTCCISSFSHDDRKRKCLSLCCADHGPACTVRILDLPPCLCCADLGFALQPAQQQLLPATLATRAWVHACLLRWPWGCVGWSSGCDLCCSCPSLNMVHLTDASLGQTILATSMAWSTSWALL